MSLIEGGPNRPAQEQPIVSINSYCLSYESNDEHELLRRLPGGRWTAVAVIVAAVIVMAATTLLISTSAVGANEPEAKIKSAHFTIGEVVADDASPLSAEGAAVSASYRSLVVEDRGIELGLEPLAGTVGVTLDEANAGMLAAELDGLRIGSASPDFANSLADAASSSDVHRFVRLNGGGAAVALDLTFPRVLGTNDYLLVQDLYGDSIITLTALNYEGAAIGTPITVGPGYQWNTGHGATPDALSWASAVGVDRFGTDIGPIPVIRVSSENAEFKVLAFAPAGTAAAPAPEQAAPVHTEVAPPVEEAKDGSLADDGSGTTTDAQTEPAAYAAVGVDAKIQPAIAVGGEGCTTASDVANADTTIGQAATYCFVVTNLGTTHLTDIAITDSKLGLNNANLPSVSSAVLLAPGDQAVYYHHATVSPRSAEDLTVATARPTDADGGPVTGLISPSGANGPGAVETIPTGKSSDGPTRADAPPVLANVVTSETAAADVTASGVTAADGQAPVAAAEPTRAPIEPVTQLALTGLVTEPWVLVIFAMAFIFIGYTAYAAFRQNMPTDENSGHDQLDALGFD